MIRNGKAEKRFFAINRHGHFHGNMRGTFMFKHVPTYIFMLYYVF